MNENESMAAEQQAPDVSAEIAALSAEIKSLRSDIIAMLKSFTAPAAAPEDEPAEVAEEITVKTVDELLKGE